MNTSAHDGFFFMEQEDVYRIDGLTDIERALQLEAEEVEAEESMREESKVHRKPDGSGNLWETSLSAVGNGANEFEDVNSPELIMDSMGIQLDDRNHVDNTNSYDEGISPPKKVPFHHVGMHDSCIDGSDESLVPHFGQEFADDEAAYTFYNTYARVMGFSVRRFRVERSRKRMEPNGKGAILSKEFVCSREGRKAECSQSEVPECNRHDETRIGCPASFRVRPVQGVWVVDRFVKEHNHELVSERDIFRLRSHQSMTDSVKGMVDNLLSCGFGPSAIFDVVQQTLGGYANVGVSEQVFLNYLKRKSSTFLGQDCQLMLDYFYRAQLRDPNFVYSISTDVEGTMNRLFWADGRARSAYEVFGDVVVFDTTYKKNRYRWPFAPFTGVNHHGQSILFGCGLISDETDVSFEWLFNAWKSAMGHRAPVAIITDMGKGIIAAVPRVFPGIKHRFCSWHISKHILEHLGKLFSATTDLKKDFRSCLYQSKTIEEFETSWREMLERYQLSYHRWLNYMYNLRDHWVPVYLRGTFLAGMSSTQRSEGLNYYFRGYFKLSTPLCRFVKQYERAVNRRREREADKDFRTLTTVANLSSGNPIEIQASKVYMRTIFEIFKKHLYQSSFLHANEGMGDGDGRKFYVGPFGVLDEHRCVVTYIESNDEISCTCKMYEFMGIFCKHILKVLQKLDFQEIPSKYVLKRWTIEARNKTACGHGDFDDTMGAIGPHYFWDLQENIKKVVGVATVSTEHCNAAILGLEELFQKLTLLPPLVVTQGTQESTLHRQLEGVCDGNSSVGTFKSPLPTITVGRPKQSREKHPMEESNRRRNKCSICKSLGHNKVTCTKGGVALDEDGRSEIRSL